jgi:hypothetical protein
MGRDGRSGSSAVDLAVVLGRISRILQLNQTAGNFGKV